MPSTNPYNIFYVSRIWLIASTLLLAMLCALAPMLLTPAIFILTIATWKRSTHAYTNESYTEHCKNIYFMNFSFFSLIAQMAIALSANKTFGYPPIAGFLASLILPATLYTAYQLAKKSKPPTPAYDLKGDRIYPHAKFKKFNLLWVAAGVAILSVLKPYTTDNNNLLTVLALTLSACALFMVFSARNSISALQSLREQEQRLSIRYKFGNLEEIRQLRTNSWFARTFSSFFKALSNKR